MKENIHSGHRARIRELAYKTDFKNMEQHQVLELLLSYVIPRSDTNPLAHRLINEFGSFSGVLDASFDDLIKVKGVGNKTAYFLTGLKNFFFVYRESSIEKCIKINSIGVAINLAKNLLMGKTVEEFYAIYLDAGNTVKHIECVNSGTQNKTYVDIKKITQSAFKHKAIRVIVCHNHPKGVAVPSTEDDKLTNALIIGLYPNNVLVLDHIIIADSNFYSYHDSGILSNFYKTAKETFNFTVAMQDGGEYSNDLSALENI